MLARKTFSVNVIQYSCYFHFKSEQFLLIFHFKSEQLA